MHYTVAVFTDGQQSVDSLLAPFNENIEGNPSDNCKWDWYSIGGRWGGELYAKDEDGEYDWLDGALARDIDFESMRKQCAQDLTPYQEFMSKDTIYSKEYLKELYPNEETYIQKNTEFSTYARLTPDGVWHEPGKMGWFSSSETPEENTNWHNEYYETFIKPAIENNWMLTIVDCHI